MTWRKEEGRIAREKSTGSREEKLKLIYKALTGLRFLPPLPALVHLLLCPFMHSPLKFESCSEGQWAREIPDRQTVRVRSYRQVRKMANPQLLPHPPDLRQTQWAFAPTTGPSSLPSLWPHCFLGLVQTGQICLGKFWTCFLKALGHWGPLSSTKVTHAKLTKGPAPFHQNHLECPGEFRICSALCLWRKTFLFPHLFFLLLASTLESAEAALEGKVKCHNETIKPAGNTDVDIVPSLPSTESPLRAELVRESGSSRFK